MERVALTERERACRECAAYLAQLGIICDGCPLSPGGPRCCTLPPLHERELREAELRGKDG